MGEANMELRNARSATLFQRKSAEKKAVLQDFVIKSVIGKGSFGKVFLVRRQTPVVFLP
jgi:hypothetical protein